MKPFRYRPLPLSATTAASPARRSVTHPELRTLRKFAGRSKVAPTTELFPMSQINEALKHVREGKARYRAVLKADL